jgi:hypothetical protein
MANQLQLISGSKTYTQSLFTYYGGSMATTIYIPPGTYTAKVLAWAPGAGQYDGTQIVTTVPDPVRVTGDTTLNIAVPAAPTLYTVSGNAGPVDYIDATVGLSIMSDDGVYTCYSSITNGKYSCKLPAGNYLAGFQATGTGVTPESLGLHNIARFTVSGDTTQNLVIPTLVTLSGTASFAGGTPAGTVTITAQDASAPTTSDVYYIRDILSTFALSPFTGPYSMQVTDNRSYNMSMAYSVYGSTTTTNATGTVYYTPTNDRTATVAGNTTFNFSAPAVPSSVTITGKVTDGTGKALQYIGVTARSSSLSGVPSLRYTSNTVYSGADGSYTLVVPTGTDYTITFAPYGGISLTQ